MASTSFKTAALAALMLLSSVTVIGQALLPQPAPLRFVDGKAGISLESAIKESCQNGGAVVVDSKYPGREPIPATACDHHVVVLDLRQADSATGRLNVKNFGAAGDGNTDDTVAIRGAIAYASVHLADKGAALIYFPAGTFVVKGELRITSQLTITGDGPGVSTIKEVDPTSNLFTIARSHACATGQCPGGIINIALAGNGHLTTGNLLEIQNNEEYHLEHLTMFNHGGRGLQLNGDSERLDSHDLAISLVRWPIVIASDSNESYFYTTKVMFPGETLDGWCYNVNCVDGKYPAQGSIAPDPHAAVSVYVADDVGFYGGSIKPLQMIGGFKAFNTGVTTLDHFYFEYGYVNPGVIAGGVPDWTTLTAPLSASAVSAPVKDTAWMPQYYTSAADVPPEKAYRVYVLIPPDFLWGSKDLSSLGNGIARGSYETVGVAGFAGDGAVHLGQSSRGMMNTMARAWPAGTIIEAMDTGVYGLRVSNSHINEQDDFSAMGPKGAHLTPDCDNTGLKTCAEIILGYIPDGRWVQPHGDPGDVNTEGAVTVYLDNDKMFQGGPHGGVIAVHSRGFLSMSGISGGPSDGETAEVPYAASIASITGGKAIEVPTYTNGKHPSFYFFDGSNGRVMSSDSGFFTQFASIYEGYGKSLNGRQYANSYSIFDIPPSGKQPLNSFTLTGGPDGITPPGLRYDRWNGKSWTSLFSVNAASSSSADLSIAGVVTAQGFRIGNGPVMTSVTGNSLSGGSRSGEVGASPPASTLAGKTNAIGGLPLHAGQCATGTAAVRGAGTGMAATTSPETSPGDGFVWQALVSRPNTVTVKLCALAAGTPAPASYDIRVFP